MPVVACIAPEPALISSPALVLEHISPTPAVGLLPDPVEVLPSTALRVIEDLVKGIKIFSRIRVQPRYGHGILQGLLPGQGSMAFSGAEHGHGTLQGLRRGGGPVGGLQSSVPGQSSTARRRAHLHELLPDDVVDEELEERMAAHELWLEDPFCGALLATVQAV